VVDDPNTTVPGVAEIEALPVVLGGFLAAGAWARSAADAAASAAMDITRLIGSPPACGETASSPGVALLFGETLEADGSCAAARAL
jgi:hypothetical protein